MRQIGGRLGAELAKYIHPLNEQHPGVYKVCKGQVAPDTGNIQDTLAIASEQSKQFSASLSSDVHATTNKKVKSMESIWKAVNHVIRGGLKRRNAVQSDVGRVLSAQHGCSRLLTVRPEPGPSNPDVLVVEDG